MSSMRAYNRTFLDLVKKPKEAVEVMYRGTLSVPSDPNALKLIRVGTFAPEYSSQALRILLAPRPPDHGPTTIKSSTTEYLTGCLETIRGEVWGFCSGKLEGTKGYLDKNCPPIYVQMRNDEGKMSFSSHWEDNRWSECDKFNWNLAIIEHTLCCLIPTRDRLVIHSLGQRVPLDSVSRGRHDGPEHSEKINILGFVKPFVVDMCCILSLIQWGGGRLLQGVACPETRPKFDFVHDIPFNLDIPINQSQAAGVQKMCHVVEGIQGPPGTGKSTTIFHIVTSMFPPEHLALVTCVQNKAIDSIAEKFSKAQEGSLPFFVVGRPENLGCFAARYIVDEQVNRHPLVKRVEGRYRLHRIFAIWYHKYRKHLESIVEGNLELRDAIKLSDRLKHLELKRQGKENPPPRVFSWNRLWNAYIRQQPVWLAAQDVNETIRRLNEDVVEMRADVKLNIIDQAKAVLCTIDSLSAIVGNDDYETVMSRPKIAIMDESGTVPEYKIPALSYFGCRAIVAIGDHKQLAPFSHAPVIDNQPIPGFFHRLANTLGDQVHMLTEQYRMHPEICKFISNNFYEGQLITNPEISALRLGKRGGITWVDYPETSAETTKSSHDTSPINYLEIELIMDFLKSHAGAATISTKSIMVITFYKKQFKELENCAVMAGFATRNKETKVITYQDNLRIVTVDAAQGSEADIVILSCVRCNKERNIGFLWNRNRLCVALSRAKEALVVVGSSKTLSKNEVFSRLHGAARVVKRVSEAVVEPRIRCI